MKSVFVIAIPLSAPQTPPSVQEEALLLPD